ncbi:hypothetical protein TYRP_004074 [Tyrophagus putrescentiae]|nr:hypothetical protein TYRP_004074 [Tyrophagus putrescentiae]
MGVGRTLHPAPVSLLVAVSTQARIGLRHLQLEGKEAHPVQGALDVDGGGALLADKGHRHIGQLALLEVTRLDGARLDGDALHLAVAAVGEGHDRRLGLTAAQQKEE